MATNRASSPGPFEGPGNKRRRQGSDIDLTTDNGYLAFYVISAHDGGKIKANAFAINKSIYSMVGTTKEIKFLRSGDLLVEVASRQQAINIQQKMDKILDQRVTVTPHRTLNYSKGVIRSQHLAEVDVNEIKSELQNQGVVDVRRLGKSASFVLTFATPHLPAYVTAAFLRLTVSPFIPSPLRCYKCQRIGHGSKFCKSSEHTCENCAQSGHESKECHSNPLCANCSGEHKSSDPSCPALVKEKQALKLKTTQNISITQARRQIDDQCSFNKTKTYAEAASRPAVTTATVACQTEPGLILDLVKDMLKSPEFFALLKQAVSEVPVQPGTQAAAAPVANKPIISDTLGRPEHEAMDTVISQDIAPTAASIKPSSKNVSTSKTSQQKPESSSRGHTMGASSAERVPTHQATLSVKPQSSRDLRQIIKNRQNSGVNSVTPSHPAYQGKNYRK